MIVYLYGFFQHDILVRVLAAVPDGVLRRAVAAGEECDPATVLAPVLRLGRAGVRVAHGGLHLL